ncbi:hypothetical protein I4U23_021817 [Adineta vaga]|nr:hypothetical protein I4U23_021817 [Adineta vaga]
MLLIRILFCSVVAVSSLQINLDLTEWTNVNEDNNELSHDCLHIDTSNEHENYPRQTTSYCLSEWPSTWKIEEIHYDQKFTFAQLANRNITSEHLYLWSSPIDTIESYQFYLDQRLTSTDLSLERKIYYNCSEARFGPLCQYEFDDLQPNYTSINEMISMFYRKNMYTPTNLTCYMHLECNLGSTSLCLDWNHICDNVIQCMNGEDEEHCWQMETNECTDEEFRCKNGQCISSIFLNDDIYIPDCLDGSDIYIEHGVDFYGDFYEPTLRSEDIICWDKYHPSVWSSLLCSNKRIEIFYQSMSLVKADSMSDQCWSALQCYLQIHHPSGQLSDEVEQNKTCQKIIEENCTDMFYMPSVPIAFGFNPNDTVIAYNNSTCRLLKDAIPWIRQFTLGRRVIPSMMTLIYMELFKCNTLRRNDSTICNHVGMYKCLNSSKCIAKICLFDGNRDCDYGDDEDDKQQFLIDTYCSERTSQFHLNCSGTNKCISRKMVEDSFCDCGVDERGMCHDEDLDFSDIRKQISFPTICDGFVDLEPLIIDEQNHTDETDCEQWLCKNIYTHCNGYWNCFSGIDEVNCYPSLLLNYNCSSDNHLCVKPNKTDLMCLPIDQSNDGKIDCLGATDEPQLCRNNFRDYASGFYCKQHNQKTDCIYRSSLCSGHSICLANEDEQFCHMIQTNKLFLSDACGKDQVWILPEREEFLCNLFKLTPTRKMIHFPLGHVNKSSKNITKVDEMISMSSINEANVARQQRCYRGL